MSIQAAVDRCKRDLLEVENDPNDDIVVVIDTCGERTSKKDMIAFGVDFQGWKKIEVFPNRPTNKGGKELMRGYFSWTLRNVLRRGDIDNDRKFYLTPVRAGVDTCISVHAKKSAALFQKDWKGINFSGSTIQSLSDEADKYEKEVIPNIPFPNDI